MDALIERLEAAKAGSRELDAEIWLCLYRPEPPSVVKALEMRMWHDGRGHMILETDKGEEVADDLGIMPATISLDAALALAERVLPGWEFVMATNTQPWVQAYPPGTVAECMDAVAASTLPLALCIAVLKAKL